jgi:hypothetical protein
LRNGGCWRVRGWLRTRSWWRVRGLLRTRGQWRSRGRVGTCGWFGSCRYSWGRYQGDGSLCFQDTCSIKYRKRQLCVDARPRSNHILAYRRTPTSILVVPVGKGIAITNTGACTEIGLDTKKLQLEGMHNYHVKTPGYDTLCGG